MHPLLVSALIVVVFMSSCATKPEAPVGAAAAAEQPEPVKPEIAEPAEPAISREELVSEAYSSIGLLVSVGDAEEAIAAYQEAQLESPDEPETQVLLANLYVFAGRLAEAREILDAVLEIEPTNPDALYARALISAADGDTEEQLGLLERLVEAHPDHADGHASIGEIYLQRRRYDRARAAFEQSLQHDKDNFVALVGLGNLHLRQDRPAQAEEVLTAAIEVAPGYSFAYSDRGKARAIQQDFVRAEEDMDRAIDLDPSYSFNYFDRGRVRLERRRFDDAIADFTTAIEIEPDVFMSYVYRGRAFGALGQTGLAIQDYETAVSMRPDYAPAYGPLGTLYVVDSRLADAATMFRQAYEDEPRRTWFALLATLALREAGRPQEATRFLEEAVASFPRDSLYYEMGRFLLRPSYDAQVRQALQNEDNALLRSQLYFYLGWQYELNGNPRSARAAYLTVLDAAGSGLAETVLAEARLKKLDEGGDG